MLLEQLLLMRLAESPFFIALEAPAMLMIDKEVFHEDVFESCLDGTLAPVVFFTIAFAKGFLVQCSDFGEGVPAHRHAEPNASGDFRIEWNHFAELLVNCLERKAVE